MNQEIEAAKKHALAAARNETTRLLAERTEQEHQQQADEQRREIGLKSMAESMLNDQRDHQRMIAEAVLGQEKMLYADMERYHSFQKKLLSPSLTPYSFNVPKSRRTSEALHLQGERSLLENERKKVEHEKRCIEEEKRLAALEIEQRASMARAELEAGRERYFPVFSLHLARTQHIVLSFVWT